MYPEIIEILAFLGAIGDYSYIDRIGNAVDEVTLMESVRDAIRAYYTNCLGETKCVIYDKEKNLGVYCPSIDAESIDKAVSVMLAKLGKSTRVEMIKLSREIALKAYAEIPVVRDKLKCSQPAQQAQQPTQQAQQPAPQAQQ
ncbi:hypothetical protein TCELL_1019 [Thermogladius calderae 1633]|uniref:Uncharacterized protein n=1 Tax=Thermogladius calderae (strain DSM 22663 / VKM B-2946 / 1633) TaxID=1184251 RepID=I3TFA4_THEC1|nr:hypothetical protein [Thermogladius calderae]AFK51442.1 hypothetical protein TCELL_1019 [Thermogladius calderae 1633]